MKDSIYAASGDSKTDAGFSKMEYGISLCI